MTKTRVWGIVSAPEGGIMGVFSTSTAAPIKRTGFDAAFAGFEDKRQYSDWKFIYRPDAPAQRSPLNGPR